MSGPDHSILVGASKGTGHVLAGTLLGAGHQVTVLSRSPPAGLPDAQHVAVDLRDGETVDAAVHKLRTELPFRNLVFLQRLRADEGADQWHDELAISVDATRRIVDGLVEARAAEEPGAIVVVSSLASDLVVADQSLGYHVAKAALNAMVRYYAVKLASAGIRVNAVTPGQVLKPEAEPYFRDHPSAYEARVRHAPLRRMATAQEIADVITYLCSDQASFITGQVVVADGGMSLVFQGSLA